MNIKSSRLSDFDGNRNNNFTLIRITLAWLVLYSHSYAIQKVVGINDLLHPIYKGSIHTGNVAISGFFAISGFLVAASFIKRGVIDYSISRALRIFPALIVCVLASMFIVGPIFTDLNFSEYFSSNEFFSYFINLIPFVNVKFSLPGVYSDNIRNSINGSLWTLMPELRLYFFLAVVGFLGLLKTRVLANVTIASLFLFGVFFYQDIPFIGWGINVDWPLVSMYFLIGVFFYINRRDIILDYKLAFLSLILMLAAMGKEWFPYVFPIPFVYCIFWVAYATPFVNLDQKIGDLSYGLYIFAWPIQQSVAAVLPSIGPYGNMAISTVLVLFLSYLSWRYIEKPALGLKAKLLGVNKVKNIILGKFENTFINRKK